MQPTEPHKLHRNDSPDTSVKSAHKIDSSKLKQLVFNEIEAAGGYGITAKEIVAKHPHLPYSSVTARPKSLQEDDLIYYLGDKRENARVMRVKRTQLNLL